MAVQVALVHSTTYRFDRLVGLGPHVVRLRPAPHCRTPILAYSLTVRPEPHFINWQQDVYGNHLARVVFPEKSTELSVTVDLIADLTVINPFDFFIEEYAETYPFAYPDSLARDLEPYRRTVTEPGSITLSPVVQAWVQERRPADAVRTVQFLADLVQAVQKAVGYTVRLETGVYSPEQTLTGAIGSCRDSAWLLVAALRELGFAARFVSGYLVQLSSDDPAMGGPAQDFTDLHAWAEVYLPGAGWIGLDATSGLFAGEGHIPLSATPEPSDSAPISGAVDPCVASMDFYNSVRRFREPPRTTLPYTAAQWESITALGDHVDSVLTAGDVRLTMGGEPTFVAAGSDQEPEWSVEADGPEKRAMAAVLSEKLKATYAPGGVVHHGQGKWYPGEPLPRWQTAITWRKDGEPLWRVPSLLSSPWSPVTVPATTERAGELTRAIAARLGISGDYVLPAYEDELAATAFEARLPAGPPPGESVEDLDPGALAGWVLPLHRIEDGTTWATAVWRFRRGRLVLIGGASPVGLRLPLDSITWTPPDPRPEPQVPFAPLEPLPVPAVAALGETTVTPVEQAPPTALALEVRDGRTYVFLPPLDSMDDAVGLLAAIEQAAAGLGLPVVLEGYPLPSDSRTSSITVAPDPGVIEVNVHPATSWRELVSITTDLDISARQVGLATEKFMLDGTHTGTGGGSHVTLGGPTPADSPILRRPDLLVSMITYFQHHPALSYLFSGRFVGPTSQAPRVDEARHDSLYELEIAFDQLDRITDEQADVRPWYVDRALRHLLVDLTGNTHRAEFCIDKLYSPDSSRGRLGLLELRSFEMQPHPQLTLVQTLLIRALVARFWTEPYRAPLVRWGTALHDRFLLPAFAAADIAEVAEDLRRHGFAFERDWFDPFLEFRFARLGRVDVGPVSLELRSAVEPWHVLGEEAAGSSTARYVDSSLERVQIEVAGHTPGRHVVTCNGVAVPLHPVPGAEGGEVAGVRFRAWAPPSALHPMIGIHSPLVFDVVDTWNHRSMGGCTYHVVHPGGRAYDVLPVNAHEAESRRAARFTVMGHTADSVEVLHPAPAAEQLYTLDLRRARAGR